MNKIGKITEIANLIWNVIQMVLSFLKEKEDQKLASLDLENPPQKDKKAVKA